jgi:hypothetical protein
VSVVHCICTDKTILSFPFLSTPYFTILFSVLSIQLTTKFNSGGIRSNLQTEGGRAVLKWTSWLWKTPHQGAATQVYCAVQPGIEQEAGQFYDNAAVYEADHFERLGSGVSKEERVKLYNYTEEFLAKYGAK